MIVTIKGLNVEVDEEFVELALQKGWCLSGHGKCYFHRNRNGETEALHRIIAGAKKGEWVDHINLNPLDNRKTNLRICTPQQSRMNIRGYSSTGFKGVYLEKGRTRWRARIWFKGRRVNLGAFSNPAEASEAYKKAAVTLAGEFARW